jgi:rare lipoprotein A
MNAIAIHKNTRSRRLLSVAGVVLVILFGVTITPCGSAQQAAQASPPHHWYQIGRASWYGGFFQGRETANGENFDMYAMTCAHRSLPMGALVRVTNLENNRSVVVRVNDRGPVPRSRVIDLSYAAARLLGFSKQGLAPVRLELITDDPQLAQLAFPTSGN